MILSPPAKINLGLNVLRKRLDGYHEIESCMTEIPLCDTLKISLSETFNFVNTGLTIAGRPEDNLCVKAYHLLKKHYDLLPAVCIQLHKNIPMGAGLGGGSSDATHVLIGLNSLFQLGLSDDKLKKLAAELGSDCPFFVERGTQLAKGRGEILSPLELGLKGNFLKLINPGIYIDTGEAYRHVRLNEDYSVTEIIALPVAEWKDKLVNGFEPFIFEKYAEIEDLRNHLYDEGAIFAGLCGSGSSVFGIFEEEPKITSEYFFAKIMQWQ